MRAFELQLPLGDGPAGQLAARRLDHLRLLPGIEDHDVQRLARHFSSLRAIYAASEDELARIVGDVCAARLRWFLDAPLDAAPPISRLGGMRDAA
jgi:ERCC4-type nuclease